MEMKRFIELYCLSVCFAFLVISAKTFAEDDLKSSEHTVPERITMSRVPFPMILSPFIVRITSCDLERIVRLCPEVYNQFTNGEYDAVIEKAQNVLKENSEWWESAELINKPEYYTSEKNPYLFSEYGRLLAIAYELKGEWNKARLAYSMAYGEGSEACRWADFRLKYAAGIHDPTGYAQIEWVDQLNYLIEDEQLPLVSSGNENWGNMDDRDWLALWKFRLNCALVICPELLFVTTINEIDLTLRAGKNFFEIEKESYERFVDAYEKICEEVKPSYISDRERQRIVLLKELKSMPYRNRPEKAKNDSLSPSSN